MPSGLTAMALRQQEHRFSDEEAHAERQLAWPLRGHPLRGRAPVGTLADLGRAFLYARYNADLSAAGLKELGCGNMDPEKVQKLDAVDQIDNLLEIGKPEDYLDAARRAFDGLGSNWYDFLRGQFGQPQDSARLSIEPGIARSASTIRDCS